MLKQGSLYYSENAHVEECNCGLKGFFSWDQSFETSNISNAVLFGDLGFKNSKKRKPPHTPAIFCLHHLSN